MKAVILAAGFGSRLRMQLPKGLTLLPNGKSILGNQISLLQELGIKEIVVVVGFKKELIMETYPKVLYVYNPYFHITNTAKSLEMALELIGPDDVVWMNGDVFFEREVLEKIIKAKGNVIAVNKFTCGEEEVKYKVNTNNELLQISKDLDLNEADGEAVGINKIVKRDFSVFLQNLKTCSDQDYFEKAIEISIEKDNLIFRTVDISENKCLEIDFPDDLRRVERMF